MTNLEELRFAIEDLYHGSYKWQRMALLNLSNGGCVVAATGTGKTRLCVLQMMKIKYRAMQQGKPFKALVCVPTKALQIQWMEYLSEVFPDTTIGFKLGGIEEIHIIIVNSLRYKVLNGYTIAVFDEWHTLASHTNISILNINHDRIGYILGITATLERADGLHNNLLPFAEVVYEYPLAKAVIDGIINPFEVINFEIPLTPKEESTIQEVSYGISELTAVMLNIGKEWWLKNGGKRNFNPVSIATDILAFASFEDKAWSNGELKQAIRYMQLIGLRKKLIYDCFHRPVLVSKLVKANLDKTIIIFGESIKALDKIGEILSTMDIQFTKYHSKLHPEEAKKNLEDFNTGKVEILLTAKALDSGYDIKRANMCIISSGTSSGLRLIQRIGRIVRKEKDKNISKVYQLYTDTQEKKWVVKRMEGANIKFE